ncbi:hypothetical protein GIB67_022758 [Kingdonia uniflora]|uniref:ATP-dependent Clp protease proteolytic subunit n=1 Tax=Kingdonia uniflora TaxID=39325 RepID=A0A7J7LJY5_9MAGN|nr:hypothetical protein GIB67_022758 [Kingdonia uniflora]
MVFLSIEDLARDLFIFINYPDGGAIFEIGIFYMMQYVTPDVHTICMGLVASMASLILVKGKITQHLAFPHA